MKPEIHLDHGGASQFSSIFFEMNALNMYFCVQKCPQKNLCYVSRIMVSRGNQIAETSHLQQKPFYHTGVKHRY